MARVSHNTPRNASALYVPSVVLALVIHAGAIYGWKQGPPNLLALEAQDTRTEVELFETAAQSQQEVTTARPIEQTPPQAPPEDPPSPESPPERVPPPELTGAPPVEKIPATPVQPSIKEQVSEPGPVPEPVPPPPMPPPPSPARPHTSARSAPSTKTGSSTDSGTTRNDNASKTIGKPVYKVPPAVKYPAESRAAGEQGTVVLRIQVNAAGKPVEVAVITSSGFSRLDRAAVEGGWRSRIDNAFEGAQFEAPLRFSLKN